MKNNSKGSSLVEIMVIMLIIVTGVTGMYTIYSGSQNMSNNLDMKIQAIQIAREGIEAMNNIRDTNWKMFSTDRNNCWNTLNYNSMCVGDNGTSTDITTGSYTIYQEPAPSYKWKIKQITSGEETQDYKDSNYRTDYRIYESFDGFYNQPISVTTENETVFTREIEVTYLKIDSSGDRYDIDSVSTSDTNDPVMKVTSKVMWVDSSRETPYTVEFSTYLSNWKAIN